MLRMAGKRTEGEARSRVRDDRRYVLTAGTKLLAMKMLEESLRRLQTDHLDLWQIHGVVFENDPDLFIRPNGAAEALRLAKQQGKARFVGFPGHKDPNVHLKMLHTGVQMPPNPFDANFDLSFERQVLPELTRSKIAVLGMKPMGGTAAGRETGDRQRGGDAALCHEPSGHNNHNRHG
jgi:aryl-alcohol dehydrogenase-like predicted oxidoreductase